MSKRYIIIGAGASALAFSSEIANNADEIIVISDGPNSDFYDIPDNNSIKPSKWASIATNSKLSYTAYVNKAESMRINNYSQGTGIGGTTNINAMMFTLGNSLIYGRYWPSSWNSVELLK